VCSYGGELTRECGRNLSEVTKKWQKSKQEKKLKKEGIIAMVPTHQKRKKPNRFDVMSLRFQDREKEVKNVGAVQRVGSGTS